jgi:hypothetical protein
MTDTTTINPGVRGHTRSTWRDESHLRGLLLNLLRNHPEEERSELEKLYLAKAKGGNFRARPANEALIDEALLRVFDNDFGRLQTPARPQRRKAVPLSDEDIAAAEQRFAKIILLDMVMPNGKKMRDCTGGEMTQFGGWYIKVGERVGIDGIVGNELNEKQVARIFAADRR